jgi:DNA polymerase
MAKISKLMQLKKLYLEKSLGFNYSSEFTAKIQVSHNNKTLSSLNDHISNCFLCESAKTRRNVLKGSGNKMARIFFILPQPNMIDDDNNTILAGRGGVLLSKILKNVLDINIEDVYLSYIVKCKLVNSQKPSHIEVSNCKDYLHQELSIIKPKLIVTLGEDSFNYLTGNTNSFSQTTQRVLKFMDYDLISTFHLNDLLQNPSLKKEAFMDFKLIKSFI